MCHLPLGVSGHSLLNPLALNVQCKTLQFCKAGNIVSKFIFFTTNLLHKKLVFFDILVV